MPPLPKNQDLNALKQAAKPRTRDTLDGVCRRLIKVLDKKANANQKIDIQILKYTNNEKNCFNDRYRKYCLGNESKHRFGAVGMIVCRPPAQYKDEKCENIFEYASKGWCYQKRLGQVLSQYTEEDIKKALQETEVELMIAFTKQLISKIGTASAEYCWHEETITVLGKNWKNYKVFLSEEIIAEAKRLGGDAGKKLCVSAQDPGSIIGKIMRVKRHWWGLSAREDAGNLLKINNCITSLSGEKKENDLPRSMTFAIAATGRTDSVMLDTLPVRKANVVEASSTSAFHK